MKENDSLPNPRASDEVQGLPLGMQQMKHGFQGVGMMVPILAGDTLTSLTAMGESYTCGRAGLGQKKGLNRFSEVKVLEYFMQL